MAFADARQCTAKSKRSGERCKNPAVRGMTKCRMHGGRSLYGINHPNFRHGGYSKHALAKIWYVANAIEIRRRMQPSPEQLFRMVRESNPCPVCGEFLGWDTRRKYCSPACRQKAYRQRRQVHK